MKLGFTAMTLMFLSMSALAQIKPCEELRAEIQTKIENNGVRYFTLTIVPVDQVNETEGKVVGSCDGGTQRIVYKRG